MPPSSTPSAGSSNPTSSRAFACGATPERSAAGAGFEDGHANRDAGLNLIEDDAARSVGDRVVDLDAAVHRAGVHDDRVCFRAREGLETETEGPAVLARRRDERVVESLALDAQHHD